MFKWRVFPDSSAIMQVIKCMICTVRYLLAGCICSIWYLCKL